MKKIFLAIPAFLITVSASSFYLAQKSPAESNRDKVEITYYQSNKYEIVRGELTIYCDGNKSSWGITTIYKDKDTTECKK